MKRIQSGEGATDLGSVEQVAIVGEMTIVGGEGIQIERPTIVPIIEEIDNMRACLAGVRDYAEALPDVYDGADILAVARGVLVLLERHGL